MVLECRKDPDLACKIRWVDGQAHKRGVSFYDIVLLLLQINEASARARAWRNKA